MYICNVYLYYKKKKTRLAAARTAQQERVTGGVVYTGACFDAAAADSVSRSRRLYMYNLHTQGAGARAFIIFSSPPAGARERDTRCLAAAAATMCVCVWSERLAASGDNFSTVDFKPGERARAPCDERLISERSVWNERVSACLLRGREGGGEREG